MNEQAPNAKGGDWEPVISRSIGTKAHSSTRRYGREGEKMKRGTGPGEKARGNSG